MPKRQSLFQNVNPFATQKLQPAIIIHRCVFHGFKLYTAFSHGQGQVTLALLFLCLADKKFAKTTPKTIIFKEDQSMPRMSKKRRLEMSMFINSKGRSTTVFARFVPTTASRATRRLFSIAQSTRYAKRSQEVDQFKKFQEIGHSPLTNALFLRCKRKFLS